MASAALAMAVHRPDRLALELETYVTAEATTRRPLDLLGIHGFLLRSSLAASALGDSRWRQRWKTLGLEAIATSFRQACQSQTLGHLGEVLRSPIAPDGEQDL